MSQRLKDAAGEFIQSFELGDEKAYDFLFRRYFPPLCFFANKLVRNGEDAEDIVQESFINLWNRRDHLRTIEHIKSYLYTAVRNSCINFLRKKNLMTTVDFATELATESFERDVIFAETINEVYQLIQQLPPRMQEVFRLYYLEGKNYKEIGDILHTDPETVRSQRGKALKFIRKIFIPG